MQGGTKKGVCAGDSTRQLQAAGGRMYGNGVRQDARHVHGDLADLVVAVERAEVLHLLLEGGDELRHAVPQATAAAANNPGTRQATAHRGRGGRT